MVKLNKLNRLWRFLRPSRRTSASRNYHEPAHEALITGWALFGEWKQAAGTKLPLQVRAADAARTWIAGGGTWEADPQLKEAIQLGTRQPWVWSATEAAFLKRSLSRRNRVRILLTGIGTLALSAGLLARYNANDANRERLLQKARSLALQAETNRTEYPGDSPRTLSLAVQSVRTAYTPEGFGTLASILAQMAHPAEVWQHAAAINCLGRSGNSAILAAGTADGQVTLRNMRDGQVRAVLQNTSPVQRLFVSHTGRIVAGINQGEDSLTVWSGPQWNQSAGLRFEGQIISDVALSPDENYLVVGMLEGLPDQPDKNVLLYDLRSRPLSLVNRFALEKRPVALRFSQQDLLIVGRNSAMLWRDWQTKRPIKVKNLQWGEDINQFDATAGLDKLIVGSNKEMPSVLWSVSQGQLQKSSLSGITEDVAISENGEFAAMVRDTGTGVANGTPDMQTPTPTVTITPFDVGAGQEGLPVRLNSAVQKLTFSRDGRYLAAFCTDGSTHIYIPLYDEFIQIQLREIALIPGNKVQDCLLVTPENGAPPFVMTADAAGHLCKWLLEDRLRPSRIRAPEMDDGVMSVGFAPGEVLKSAGRSFTASWITDSKPPRPTLRSMTDPVFSSDGRFLAWSEGNSVAIQLPSGKLTSLNYKNIASQSAIQVQSLSLSESGRFVAAVLQIPGRETYTFCLWDSTSQQLLAEHSISSVSQVLTICEESEKKSALILTAPAMRNSPTLWRFDGNTGLQSIAWSQPTRDGFTTCFLPGGTGFISGDLDGQITFWTVNSQVTLSRTLQLETPIISLAVDPQGKYLACAGLDRTIRVFDLTGDSLTTNSEIARYSSDLYTTRLAFDLDGHYLAAVESLNRKGLRTYDTARLWPLPQIKLIRDSFQWSKIVDANRELEKADTLQSQLSSLGYPDNSTTS